MTFAFRLENNRRPLQALAVPLAITSAVTLGLSPALHPVSTSEWKTVTAQAKLLDTEAWISCPSYCSAPPTIPTAYGSTTEGWSAGPANVAAPFELFPTDLNWGEVLTALGNGAQEGWNAFVNDLSNLSFPSAADLLGASAGDVTSFALPSLSELANAVSSIAAQAYATLLPTADILNALLTTAPAYAFEVFAQELAQGDIVDAIGLPIAGVVGLGTLAAGFEFLALNGAVAGISATIQDLFTA